MVGIKTIFKKLWHHQLDAYEFVETPRDGKGEGSLACCSPRGRKQLDTAERLNNRNHEILHATFCEI